MPGPEVHVRSGNISAAVSLAQSTIGPVDVRRLATGGDGTIGDPWTGWEATINATAADYWFPAGYYTLSTPISLLAHTNLRGAGNNLAIITTSTTFKGEAITAMGTINGSYGAYMTIEDLAIRNGNWSVTTGGYANVGLALVAVSFVYVNRCAFSGWWRSVICDQTEMCFLDGLIMSLNYPFYGHTVAKPTAMTVTPNGTPGTTYYVYKICAVNNVGNVSLAVPAKTTTGAATLNGTDFNRIAWSASAGAITYDIYRARGGGTFGLIGNTASTSFNDTGLAATTNNKGILFPPEELACIWLVDGSDFTAPRGLTPAFGAFTNVFTATNCWFDTGSAGYGVIDDGGDNHHFIGGGFNGGSMYSMRMAGVQALSIEDMYFESGYGIQLEWHSLDAVTETSQSGNVTVTNCGFWNTTVAVGIVSVGTIRFMGNAFSSGARPQITGTSNAYSIIIDSNDGSLLQSVATGRHYQYDLIKSVPRVYPANLTLANGANNNIALTTYTGVQRIVGPTGAFSLSGITAGLAGAKLVLHNTTAYAFTLTNDATSTAANRILTLSGSDLVLPGQSTASLLYDATQSRWIVIGSSPSSSSGAALTAPVVYAGMGLTTPLVADYTSQLQVGAVAYIAADGLGIQDVFSGDSISTRYHTTPDFRSGLTYVAGIRGSANGSGATGIYLRQSSSGNGLFIGRRVNGPANIVIYEFNAANNYAGTTEYSLGGVVVYQNITWWQVVDDGTNRIISVGYDESPIGEPPTGNWRTILTVARGRFAGSDTGLGVGGYFDQTGVAVYDFANDTTVGQSAVLFSARVF